MACMRRALVALLLALSSPLCAAAEPQWIAAFGRATESQETDIVRLGYRHPLPPRDSWWMPTHVQLGASVWRVPDIRGTTRRFDLNATAVWLSNAGIKQPNGGIDLVLVQLTLSN